MIVRECHSWEGPGLTSGIDSGLRAREGTHSARGCPFSFWLVGGLRGRGRGGLGALKENLHIS